MNGAEHTDSVPQSVNATDGGERTAIAVFPHAHFTLHLAPSSTVFHISTDHEPLPQMSAPLKYSIPHAVVSFGPAGQLIRVTPGLSTQENVSQLEIHSLEVSC